MKKRKRTIDPQRWQQEHKNKSVLLSDKQYSMALLIESMSSRIIDREHLDVLAGGTVNSFIARGYLRQHSPTTVYWTRAGSEAVKHHGQADFYRQPSGRFSAYLSLETFDAKPKKEDKENAA